VLSPLVLALPLTIPANPKLYRETNYDGSKTPLIRLSAGEWSGAAYETTENGYAVQKIEGYYKYLELNNVTGRLVDSGLHVRKGIEPYRNIAVGIKGRIESYLNNNSRTSLKNQNPLRRIIEIEKNNGIPREHSHVNSHRRTATLGYRANLMIPFRFSDHLNRPLPSISDLNVLMNNIGPNKKLCPTGSVRDVYLKSSFGKLDLNSTIASWVILPNNESYYAANNSGMGFMAHIMIRDALDALQSTGFNFTAFDKDRDGFIDSLGFLHSGYGAEWGGTDSYGTYYTDRVWSHKWALFSLPTGKWTSITNISVYNYHVSSSLWGASGSEIGRIGVIAHEIGHFFGLPDLYDGFGGYGIGSYSLMANAWGSDGSQLYPPHFCAWSKIMLGWVTPVIISSNGTYSIRQACDYPELYVINYNFPLNEYLLIENRQKCGFDLGIPSAGIAIFHIDSKANDTAEGYPGQLDSKGAWPMNGNHYRVALLQADGRYDMERGINRGDSTDLFAAVACTSISPGGTSVGTAYPNTKSYQGGISVDTGIYITNISETGVAMSFNVALTPRLMPYMPSPSIKLSIPTTPVILQLRPTLPVESSIKPVPKPAVSVPGPSMPMTRPKQPFVLPAMPVLRPVPSFQRPVKPVPSPLKSAPTPSIPVKRPTLPISMPSRPVLRSSRPVQSHLTPPKPDVPPPVPDLSISASKPIRRLIPTKQRLEKH